VPASSSGGYYRPGDPLENIREEVARQRARGFSDYKMKVGGLPLHADEARVGAAREALGPTGRLALDANNAYASVAEAIKAADAFAPHDIWWFEEPLVPDDIDGHAQLAARGPIPIATGEIEATAWGFGHLLRARAAHIHQTDACVCGGVGEWMKAAHAAAAFGVQVAPHWHHNLHAQLAAARLRQGFVNDAMPILRRALELSPNDSGKLALTFLRSILTSVGDGASTEVTVSPTPTVSSAAFFSIRSTVYLTSAEVSGWPSDHFTPGRNS